MKSYQNNRTVQPLLTMCNNVLPISTIIKMLVLFIANNGIPENILYVHTAQLRGCYRPYLALVHPQPPEPLAKKKISANC